MTLPQFKNVEVHPAANIFPLMDDESFADLVADIRQHGQRESCSIWKGQLIDGRNRWLACQEIGIEPSVGEFEDDDFDVLAYVLSSNLHRRHLTTSQRAMVGGRVRDCYDERAKERKEQTEGRPKNGQPKPVETFPPVKARDEAGAALSVSGKLIDAATTVLEQGSKELIAKVDAGEVSVSKAAKIAKTVPKKEQVKATEKPRKPSKPKKKDEPRTVFTDLRRVFDAMTEPERLQAAQMWTDWTEAA